MSGALPVWEHFTVVPANVFDSLISGSDYLLVDIKQVNAVTLQGDGDTTPWGPAA